MACRHVRGDVVGRGLSPPLRDKRAGHRGLACRTQANSPRRLMTKRPWPCGSRLTCREPRRCHRAEQPYNSPHSDEQAPRRWRRSEAVWESPDALAGSCGSDRRDRSQRSNDYHGPDNTRNDHGHAQRWQRPASSYMVQVRKIGLAASPAVSAGSNPILGSFAMISEIWPLRGISAACRAACAVTCCPVLLCAE